MEEYIQHVNIALISTVCVMLLGYVILKVLERVTGMIRCFDCNKVMTDLDIRDANIRDAIKKQEQQRINRKLMIRPEKDNG